MPVVYLLTNPAMPNLVKIGHTGGTIEDRMRELSRATGVPVAFECFMAIEIPAEHIASLEKALHQAFGDNRINSRREFFEISPDRPAAILRAFQAIFNSRSVTPTEDVVESPEEQGALDSERRRGANFRFSLVGIEPGTVLRSAKSAQPDMLVGHAEKRYNPRAPRDKVG